MSIKLLTISSEQESAQKLGFGADLQLKGYADNYKNDIIIRWGNSTAYYDNAENCRGVDFQNVVNPRKAIRQNCIKHTALQSLAAVVLTPEFYEKEVPKGKRAVVRPIEHTGGKDFRVENGIFKFDNYEFYGTEFIETDTEYRVWFVGDQMFHAKRVPLTEKDEEEYPCRSNWGYSYRETMPKELYDATLKAAKQLGLEVGAADVLMYKGKYYFLELNSAPSIDTKRLIKFFRTNLIKLINSKFPQLCQNPIT
jgi:glutathione synthase/RimK-type ligase-like ATP-grasp enzyme